MHMHVPVTTQRVGRDFAFYVSTVMDLRLQKEDGGGDQNNLLNVLLFLSVLRGLQKEGSCM